MHILCLRVLVHYECVTGISILRGQQLAQGCIMNMIYTLHLSEVFAANFSLLFFFFLQPIEKWNCRNVVDLLASLNLYRYAQLFKDQEISGRKLKTMSKEDLQVSGKSGSKIGRSVWCWWWDCYHDCCVVLVVGQSPCLSLIGSDSVWKS